MSSSRKIATYLETLPIELYNIIVEYADSRDLSSIYLFNTDRGNIILTQNFFEKRYSQGLLIFFNESIFSNSLHKTLSKISFDYQISKDADLLINKILLPNEFNKGLFKVTFYLKYSDIINLLYLDIVESYNEFRYHYQHIDKRNPVTIYYNNTLMVRFNKPLIPQPLKTNIYLLIITLLKDQHRYRISLYDSYFEQDF